MNNFNQNQKDYETTVKDIKRVSIMETIAWGILYSGIGIVFVLLALQLVR